jgi:hypothetical protein
MHINFTLGYAKIDLICPSWEILRLANLVAAGDAVIALNVSFYVFVCLCRIFLDPKLLCQRVREHDWII